jgi:hypothetical protein
MKKILFALTIALLGTPMFATAQTSTAPLTADDWKKTQILLKQDIDFAKLDAAANAATNAYEKQFRINSPKISADNQTLSTKIDALVTTGMDRGAATDAVKSSDPATVTELQQLQQQLRDLAVARNNARIARGQKLIQMLPGIDPRYAPIVADAQRLIQENWTEAGGWAAPDAQ